MAIAIRGAATETSWATAAATRSPTCTFPADVAAGDILFAFFTTNSAHNASDVSSGAWSWVKLQEVDDTGTDSTSSLLWAIAPANPGNSFTFTNVFAATEFGQCVIIAYSGNYSSGSIGGSSGVERTITAGNVATSTAVAPTQNNCLHVQFIGCDPGTGAYSATVDTSPTGVERFDAKSSQADSAAYTYIQEYQQTTAASLALDATMATADEYQVIQVAFYEALAAGIATAAAAVPVPAVGVAANVSQPTPIGATAAVKITTGSIATHLYQPPSGTAAGAVPTHEVATGASGSATVVQAAPVAASAAIPTHALSIAATIQAAVAAASGACLVAALSTLGVVAAPQATAAGAVLTPTFTSAPSVAATRATASGTVPTALVQTEGEIENVPRALATAAVPTHTLTVAPTVSGAVAAAAGAVVVPRRVVTSGGTAVAWVNLVNATASGNWIEGNTTSGGGTSLQALMGDGFAEFGDTFPTGPWSAWGLSNGNTDQSVADIDFAFYLSGIDEHIYIKENDATVADVGVWNVQPLLLRIDVASAVVRYYVDGVLVYTSGNTPTFPLVVDCSLKEGASTYARMSGWTLPAGAAAPAAAAVLVPAVQAGGAAQVSPSLATAAAAVLTPGVTAAASVSAQLAAATGTVPAPSLSGKAGVAGVVASAAASVPGSGLAAKAEVAATIVAASGAALQPTVVGAAQVAASIAAAAGAVPIASVQTALGVAATVASAAAAIPEHSASGNVAVPAAASPSVAGASAIVLVPGVAARAEVAATRATGVGAIPLPGVAAGGAVGAVVSGAAGAVRQPTLTLSAQVGAGVATAQATALVPVIGGAGALSSIRAQAQAAVPAHEVAAGAVLSSATAQASAAVPVLGVTAVRVAALVAERAQAAGSVPDPGVWGVNWRPVARAGASRYLTRVTASQHSTILAGSRYRTTLHSIWEEDDLEYVTRTLTPAEVASLHVTPVELVPARSGVLLLPVLFTAEMAYHATPWSGTSAWALQYGATRRLGYIPAANSFIFAADGSEVAAAIGNSQIADLQSCVGLALNVTCFAGGALTGGDSPIRFAVMFKAVPAEAW